MSATGLLAGATIHAPLPTVLLGIAVFLLLVGLTRRSWRTKPKQKCQYVEPAPATFDSESEIVIVGAGVVGASLASVLSRDGRKVTVIERDLQEPNRIVGELLQPGGYTALKKLGLKDAAEGIDAHVVYGYVIHENASKSMVALSYPRDDSGEVLTGRSFHHGRFIMGLRREAQKDGAILVEGAASSLLEDSSGHVIGVLYKDKATGTDKTIKAKLTFVADGCFSRFRKGLVDAEVSVSSNFAGVIMRDCPQIKKGFAEIVLGTGGPLLVYQISHEDTRILVDVPKVPSDIKGYMLSEVEPQLPAHIRGPFRAAVNSSQIRTMPNSFLPPSPNPVPGVVLLGDAFNMRHPLTGGGMSVALNDVVIWRKMLHGLKDVGDHAAVLKCLKTFQWERKGSHAFVVNVLAQALYKLFSASDEYLYELRTACYQYFQIGGKAVSGPVGLLSVVAPQPHILVGHFYAVAVFGMYLIMKARFPWQLHKGVFRALMVIWKACTVMLPLIGSELKNAFQF